MSYITIKLRRGTAAQWTAQNPVLAEGEFGAETDTRKFKIGNGVGAWNSLQYWGGSGGGATLFTDLTDVPQSYTGQGGKLVRVKADASGLEFYTLTIAEGDLPTGINANKIGNGSVSNTEFQYLDGVTSAIQTQINSKENALGFTPENVANKSTSITTDQASNTKYPSVKAVYDWVTGLGYITASALTGYATQAWVTSQGYITNVITALGFTPANKAGDTFTGSISATNLSGTNTGDETQTTIKTKLGAAATGADGYLTSTDWNTFNGKQNALGYTPENSANKKLNLTDNSDTFYPSQKAVKTAVDAKQDTLVSGTNIKTINGNSVLGGGDLTISAGADILEIQVFS